jgi:osmotically-inducible protein OsmY
MYRLQNVTTLAALALAGAVTLACNSGGENANAAHNANTSAAANRNAAANANTNAVANTNRDRDVDYDSPDGLITAKVKLKQLADKDASASGVDVDTVGGVVTLSGKVETEAQKAASERVAKGVEGVKSVNNQIQVVPEGRDHAVEQKDEEVQKAVNDLLDTDAWEALDLTGKVNAGVVTLNGKVGSQGDLVRAAAAVRKVTGVRSVVTSAVAVGEAGRSAATTGANRNAKP